jgi:CheY-like chemotaxis protein
MTPTNSKQLVKIEQGQLALANLTDSRLVRKMIESALVLAGASGASTNITVLVVEDDSAMAQLLKFFLESLGLNAVIAQNGFEGLREITATDFQVVISDLVMPGMNGDEFYKRVEPRKPGLCSRFIFMTANGPDTEVGRHFLRFIQQIGGIVVYKPFEFHDLLNAISDRAGLDTATVWFRQAAEEGNAEAQHWLAYRCFDLDKSEHVRWLNRAAEQGHRKAQVRLFMLHWMGGYLPEEEKDIIQAYKWARVLTETDPADADIHVLNLREIEKKMTPEQIARGEYQARYYFVARLPAAKEFEL